MIVSPVKPWVTFSLQQLLKSEKRMLMRKPEELWIASCVKFCDLGWKHYELNSDRKMFKMKKNEEKLLKASVLNGQVVRQRTN